VKTAMVRLHMILRRYPSKNSTWDGNRFSQKRGLAIKKAIHPTPALFGVLTVRWIPN
jgi:hypothetical protein